MSSPGDMMVCDAEHAAAAQEQYRNANGSYYTGSCDALPGFSASPDVTCTASGDATALPVSTSHLDPATWQQCIWSSQGDPQLTCW